MILRFGWILIFFVTSTRVTGQQADEKKFIRYSTIDGLSDNFITGLTQDNLGYIWISTNNGLNRFDGKEIKRINQIPGKESLIKDKLNGVKRDGNDLLVYSSKGAQWINVIKNRFTNLIVSETQPAATFQNNVIDAAITHNKICLVSTFTGFYAFDSTGRLIFRYDHLQPDSNGAITGKRYGRIMVNVDKYRVLHFDKEYNMSVYDSRDNSFLSVDTYKNKLPGLYTLRGCMPIKGGFGKEKLMFLNFTSNVLMSYDVTKDQVQTIYRSSWSQQYIGWASYWSSINDSSALFNSGKTGLFTVRIDPQTLQCSIDSIPQFNNLTCTVVMLDKDNRLWVGTEYGLYCQALKKSALHSIKYPLPKNTGANHPIPFYWFLRKKDLLYAGTYSQLPILVLNARTNELKKQLSFASLSPLCNQVWSMIEYNKDTLWFATQDGLVWYDEQSGNFNRVHIAGIDSLIKPQATITLLFKDSKGIIWLQAGWGAGVFMYDPITKTTKRFLTTDKKNFLPLQVVNFVTEDRDGNIWFAENGLTRWNRKSGRFDTLITSYYGFNKDNIKIIALGNDRNGNLVFCNENNGVLIYDPGAASFKQISMAEGLPENAAFSAIALSNHYMWVATYNYITCLDQQTSKTTSFSYSDSLPSALFNTLYHDSIGKRMYFGYDNEIIWTNDKVDQPASSPLPFYIDELRIADDTTLLFPGESIQLKYTQNDITIHYTALNFEDAVNNRYAYRINQKEWITTSTENSIHFSNLSPGRYEIEIKHYTASNPQNETTKKIILLVKSPFWRTSWFFTLVGLGIVSAIFLLYKKRIHQIHQKARIDKQIAESEIKALRAQMNPHFIFNSLNSIMEMVLNDEKTNASRYLSNYAQLIRLNLEHSERTFISLRENIDYLRHYIELEHIRTSSFTYSIEVDEQLDPDEILLPPMLIQPFIENAIWYGPSVERTPMKLVIRFLKENNQLLCVVDDNGQGIEASLRTKNEKVSVHTPMGIGNVRQRIQILNEKYKLNCTLIIEDKSRMSTTGESGTMVKIRLPLNFHDL